MSTTSTRSADPFVHPALFYGDDEAYLAGTVPFVLGGLAADEPVAVSVPGPKLRLLRSALGDAAERVTLLDMTRVGRNPGRIIPGVLRAFTDRHPDRRVRIVGEPIWPSRSEAEYAACAQHEALINHAFSGTEVTILCPYDSAGLSDQALADAVATHPTLIDSTGERPSEGYAPDRVIAHYNRSLPPPSPAAVFTAVRSGTLAAVRRLATEYARHLGLVGERLDDLLLTISELAANSLKHGGGTGMIHLWVDDHHVVCQVADSGHITDPLAGRLPVPTDQLGGRGLLLVNHLADLVRVNSTREGTTVEARFALPA
ncbi:anti-sigma factor RsbA family regulatory protein [Umezawaea endophytica]|uniref:Sensor histidine kinase n=1 Tax=Umezawaea endophytica TaxID=1654476 RepID=A0A9X2VG24_9PSEU|nr:sensor histidine kinase [Umezawaea endophytica]MCS7475417.1 sensor histidine kinase [Umezawaea endophytica]